MEEINWGKIKWKSRRGMRELDLMLLPFVEHDLPNMDVKYVDIYMSLLDKSDLELFRSFHRISKLNEDDLNEMVEIIIKCHSTRAGREGV